MGQSFLINREQLQVAADNKIIKHQDYAYIVDAVAIVEAARKEAHRILLEAAKEVERQKRLGYQTGWHDAQQRLALELTKVSASHARSLVAQQRTMVKAVVDICTVVLKAESRERIFDTAFKHVSEFVRIEQFLSVRVSNDDLSSARRAVNRMVEQYSSTRFINVVADELLEAGSCVIESEQGIIDASVSTYLEQLERVMNELFALNEVASL